MQTQYVCRSERRVAMLRELSSSPPALNGIEFLEVEDLQTTLVLTFVHDLAVVPAAPLTATNVEIRGGVRVKNPRVTHVAAAAKTLYVTVAAPGDFSPYVLRLVKSPASDEPPAGIDPLLAEIEFFFKAGCPSDFDCRVVTPCPEAPQPEPAIDYLARDYTSFRRVMLDRLSTLLPDWRDRGPADPMITLVEAIAFRADELSYFQDAVATEAYLGTARTRVSVRRHARLLDYPFHDGATARVWVAFEAESDVTLPGPDPQTGIGGTKVTTAAVRLGDGVETTVHTFELLRAVTCRPAHNRIPFYTWSDEDCCLPAGATRAFLRDDGPRPLRLAKGDVVVLEQRRDPGTGEEADADRTRRHAVRLARVAAGIDPLTQVPYLDVGWDAADALPFALCVSSTKFDVVSSPPTGPMAHVLGNVALADYGDTRPEEILEPETTRPERPRRPGLAQTAIAPLTQQARVRRVGSDALVVVDTEAPAASAFSWDMGDVRPAVTVREGNRRWTARRDLLSSGRFDADFVVETEDDGHAFVRFGDGVAGRRPAADATLTARYRIGNGSVGNVGPDTISRLAVPDARVRSVRNPLPARGGADPHPLTQAKLYAPQAFRRQERAVTLTDYQTVAERHPDVQRAVATRRWTGSWHTVFITVDRRGGRDVDQTFERELTRFLERYRLAGHDVEIEPPLFVPLDVALDVCARPDHFAADVKERLLEVFSAAVLPGGTKGFFHPDNFTFGKPVYLSAIIARAMQVPGVASITPLRFQRFGRAAGTELDDGVFKPHRLEIARLDNDPNAPEHGRLDVRVLAGA
jgi:hypothetical protein